jgi:hypothetical protein
MESSDRVCDHATARLDKRIARAKAMNRGETPPPEEDSHVGRLPTAAVLGMSPEEEAEFLVEMSVPRRKAMAG